MNAFKSTRLLVSLTVVPCHCRHLAWLVAAPVLAQERSGRPIRRRSPRLPNARPTLNTVMVTANKREENIRDAAASISVIGEGQLENLGRELAGRLRVPVPGMQVQDNGSPGQTSVSLRGISALSSSATVATYLDETPLGSSGIYQGANFFTLDLLPYDIGRVEVLRGPQGTLYGASAMGGLIKYVTREPEVNSASSASAAAFDRSKTAIRAGTRASARTCR